MLEEEFRELPSPDEFSQDSLHESFKEKQLVQRQLYWRISNNCRQFLVMNDYSLSPESYTNNYFTNAI